MSAVDIKNAKQALAWRIKDWGVDNAPAKAAEFIDELVARGWVMDAAREDRPKPPRPNESCRVCGRHADRCICDNGPTTRPPEPSKHTADHIDAARRALHGGNA